jgi:hypothetical protein
MVGERGEAIATCRFHIKSNFSLRVTVAISRSTADGFKMKNIILKQYTMFIQFVNTTKNPPGESQCVSSSISDHSNHPFPAIISHKTETSAARQHCIKQPLRYSPFISLLLLFRGTSIVHPNHPQTSMWM